MVTQCEPDERAARVRVGVGRALAREIRQEDQALASGGDARRGSRDQLVRIDARRVRLRDEVRANDLVAAWGATNLMRSWDIEIDVMAGPATDNEVGEAYCLRELRVPAANARTNAHKLTDIVERLVW